MDLDNVLLDFQKQLLNKKIKITSLADGIEKLAMARIVKNILEDLCSDLNSEVLKLFNKNKIEEFSYKGKTIKPAMVSKYNCNALVEYLPDETKKRLLPLQDLHLNKSIIDSAIEEGILEAQSIQEYIDAGLVTKRVKRFIRFSDALENSNRRRPRAKQSR